MTIDISQYRCSPVILLAAAAMSLGGCQSDNTATLPGAGGGKRSNPYSCILGPAQNGYGTAFTNARVSASFTQALRNKPNGIGCPYVVDYELERLTIGVQVAEPWSTINPYEQRVDFTGLQSKWTGGYEAQFNVQYWGSDPNYADGALVEFAEPYNAGALFTTSPPMDFAYDSGGIRMATTFGPAEARVIVTGGIRYHTQQYQGTLDIPAFSTLGPATIRAISELDTNSYGWSWRIDGAPVDNPDARLTTTLSPGNHDIMALAQLADLNVDTIRATVYSRLAITIMGETAPASNSATQYVALVHGTPPFTYRWNLDGNVISTDQTISLTFGPSEEHSLTVSAWDSQGYGATEGLIIDSMNGGNAYYRAPVPNSGSPLRGITKKGVVP